MAQLKSKLADKQMLIGYTMALGAGACYGATSVIGKKVVDDYANPLTVSAFALLFGAVIMLSLTYSDVPRAVKGSGRSLLPIMIAGSCSAGGVIFTYFALTRATVVVVAPVISISPLVTLVLAHLLLRNLERITWRLVLGTLMIVGGVVIIVFGR